MGLATATLMARHGAAAVWIADRQTARFDGAREQIQAANSSTEIHIEDIDYKIMSVNLNGVMYCTRAQGLAMLTRLARLAASTILGPRLRMFPLYGIRINGALPGNTITPMTQQFFKDTPPEVYEQVMKKGGLGESIQPEDVARAIVWLLSENSLTVNGVSLPVGEGAP
ncbi:hypothetical protein IL306_012996 [Fusarium sp. DS 682]|nr:hypothetical protein IL306_012996 [Fusarium sp. DS 682]